MRLDRWGLWLFAGGMMALGLAQILFRVWLSGLQPAPAAWSPAPVGTLLAGAVLVLGGLGVLSTRFRRRAGLSLAIFWTAWLLIAHAPSLLTAPTDAPRWVSAFEVGAFALAGLMLARAGGAAASRVFGGLMLILFGAVHIIYPEAISGLIPEWAPMREQWPWLTGALQLAAGVALLTDFRARLAALGVGAMYLSWVPVVHAARVAAAPGDAFEWTFMLTAVALAGVLWLVAGASRKRVAGV